MFLADFSIGILVFVYFKSIFKVLYRVKILTLCYIYCRHSLDFVCFPSPHGIGRQPTEGFFYSKSLDNLPSLGLKVIPTPEV